MKLTSLVCLLLLPLAAPAQWQVRMSGLPPDGVFQAVALADSSTGWVSTWPQLWRTTNLGKAWIPVPISTMYGTPYVMAARGATNLVYGTTAGKILRTTDSGAHWTVVFDDSSVTNFINDLVMFDSLRGFAMGDPPDTTKHPGLLTTSDGGATWHVVANDLPVGDYQIRDRTSFVRPDLGWTKARNDGIYKTTDGGHTWQRIYTSSDPFNLFFINDSVGFYTTDTPSPSPGIFKTTDGGLTWSGPVVGYRPFWIRWAPGGKVLWAGAETLCVSTNMGESWQEVFSNRGRGGCGAFQTAAFVKDSVGLVVGACLVLSSNESPNSIAGRQDDGTPQITLQQNYPNPFNPTTTIRYVLPRHAHVTLTLYNTLGELVTTLINGEQQAGGHQIELNAAGLATGVYFYRLEAGSLVETKKLLLIR